MRLTKFCLLIGLLSFQKSHPIHTCISKIWFDENMVEIEHIIPTEDLINNPTIPWTPESKSDIENNSSTLTVERLLEEYLAQNFRLYSNGKEVTFNLDTIQVEVFETHLYLNASLKRKKQKTIRIYNGLNMHIKPVENICHTNYLGQTFTSYHQNLEKVKTIELPKK